MHQYDARKIHQTFSESFRYHRRRLGMTHREICKACGLSDSLTGKWERGACYPHLFALVAVADYMGLSIDELVGIERRDADGN